MQYPAHVSELEHKGAGAKWAVELDGILVRDVVKSSSVVQCNTLQFIVRPDGKAKMEIVRCRKCDMGKSRMPFNNGFRDRSAMSSS